MPPHLHASTTSLVHAFSYSRIHLSPKLRRPCPRAGGAPSSAQSCPRRACTRHSTTPPSAARPGCPAGLRAATDALSHRIMQPQHALMARHTPTRRTSAQAPNPHRFACGSGGATKRSVHGRCAGVTALLAWAPQHPGQVSCLVWMSNMECGHTIVPEVQDVDNEALPQWRAHQQQQRQNEAL